MAAHGGELRLSSEQGKGTTASLLIPMGEPPLVIGDTEDAAERIA